MNPIDRVYHRPICINGKDYLHIPKHLLETMYPQHSQQGNKIVESAPMPPEEIVADPKINEKQPHKPITLVKKSTCEIRQADATSKARTIQVVVRKKRSFIDDQADTENTVTSATLDYLALPSPPRFDINFGVGLTGSIEAGAPPTPNPAAGNPGADGELHSSNSGAEKVLTCHKSESDAVECDAPGSHAVSKEARGGGETGTASDLTRPVRKARAKLCRDLIIDILKSYFFDNQTYKQIVQKYDCSKGTVSKYVKLAKDLMAAEKVEVLNDALIARICADKAAPVEPDFAAVDAAVASGSKVQTCWEQYVKANSGSRRYSRTEFYNKYNAWKNGDG